MIWPGREAELLRLYLLLQPLSMLIQKMFVNCDQKNVLSSLAATALKPSIHTHLGLLSEFQLPEPCSSFTPLRRTEYVGPAYITQHYREGWTRL